MEERFTEYQEFLFNRFLHNVNTEQEKGFLIGLALAPKEYGYEEKMLAWLERNPTATLREAFDYEMTLRPQIVIEDD